MLRWMKSKRHKYRKMFNTRSFYFQAGGIWQWSRCYSRLSLVTLRILIQPSHFPMFSVALWCHGLVAQVALMVRLHGQLTVMAVSASVGLGKSIITFGGSGCEFCVASWLRRAAKTGENIWWNSKNQWLILNTVIAIIEIQSKIY